MLGLLQVLWTINIFIFCYRLRIGRITVNYVSEEADLLGTTKIEKLEKNLDHFLINYYVLLNVVCFILLEENKKTKKETV